MKKNRSSTALKVSLAISVAAAFVVFSYPNISGDSITGYATFSGSSSSWREDFNDSLSPLHWAVPDWRSPGYIPGNHIGYSEPDRVSVENGYLRINLTQERGQVDSNPNGVISRGGTVLSINKYGYGTYEWRMRMSSTGTSPTANGTAVSGSVSAGFIYVNNSQTEIDFEVEGQYPWNLYMVNWLNPDTSRDPTINDRTLTRAIVENMHNRFMTYKFVWSPGRIEYYVDGVLKANHTTKVPSAPAHFHVTHYGMNTTDAGGLATIGIPRYLYVDWVRYTAPGETPVSPPSTFDNQPPFVDITSPANNSRLANRQKIEATANDASGIRTVEFYIDGAFYGADTTAPYTIYWYTRKAAAGLHVIRAVAYDVPGNTATDQVTVFK